MYPEREALMMDPASGYTDPTICYRYFDAAGVLLYIGITNDFAIRDLAHSKAAAWRRAAHCARLELFPSLRLAECAEAHAIEEEGPVFNVKAMPQREADTVPNRWFLAKMGGLRGEYVRWVQVHLDLGARPTGLDAPEWWNEDLVFVLPYTDRASREGLAESGRKISNMAQVPFRNKG